MDHHKDIELLEKYLNQELSEADKQAFERRLANEESLAQALQERRAAHKALDYLVAKNLKSQLEELEEEGKIIPINRSRRRRMVIWSAAATVLLLLGFFFLLPSDPVTGPELVADYYETPDFGIRSANQAAVDQQPLNRGKSALNNGAYAEAIATLDSIPQSDPYYLTAQYYLGHAFYLSQQYEQAEERFARVSTGNDLRLQEDAEWYELLSCLAQDDDCQQQIDDLTEAQNHAHYRAAVEISRRLK